MRQNSRLCIRPGTRWQAGLERVGLGVFDVVGDLVEERVEQLLHAGDGRCWRSWE